MNDCRIGDFDDYQYLNKGENKNSPFTSEKMKMINQTREKLKEINNRVFTSGAKRDSNKGKIRPDLISPLMLKALGKVLAEGAEHYGERNWEKGIPQEVFKESASRHYISWMNNEDNEDHAARLIFNIMGWIHNRDKDKINEVDKKTETDI